MLYGLPIRFSPPIHEESNHRSPAFGSPSDSRFKECALARVLKSLLYYNEPTIQRLRLTRPELKTGKGVHYADLLERYAERAKQRLGQARAGKAEPELISPEPVDKSALRLGAPKRIRDPEHLKFINTQSCLICGRAPVHAHHLRFAQPRSMSNKVSDGWSVPLCFTHHRALHTVGNGEAWWVEKGIEPRQRRCDSGGRAMGSRSRQRWKK
jgi:hypothetical protein